ncbi:MAG: hypothetical protein HY321_01730 [Armatimonadetes bacterium]|nr:hypothetical protein [Armatimonadota bacterium]
MARSPAHKFGQIIGDALEASIEPLVNFMVALARVVTRQITLVRVLPLHGRAHEWGCVADAISFIERYAGPEDRTPALRYEVEIRYRNGDRIDGQFADKSAAVDFLRGYQPPELHPAL